MRIADLPQNPIDESVFTNGAFKEEMDRTRHPFFGRIPFSKKRLHQASIGFVAGIAIGAADWRTTSFGRISSFFCFPFELPCIF